MAHTLVYLLGYNRHVFVSVCVYLFYFIFFSVATEVGSKKDQDHPSVAGLESKWIIVQFLLSMHCQTKRLGG